MWYQINVTVYSLFYILIELDVISTVLLLTFLKDPKKNLPAWPLFKSGTNGVSLVMEPEKIKVK